MDKTGLLPTLFGRTSRKGQASSGQDIFSHLQNEVDRVFESFSLGRPLANLTGNGSFDPAINLAETPEAIDLTAEIPGCEPRDIEISVVGQTLTLRGEKKSEKEEKNRNYHLVERSYGVFTRSIPLPFTIDPAKVEATFDKGVLKIHLPKPPEMKAEVKTIPIKG
jgi:HSP20 family protein